MAISKKAMWLLSLAAFAAHAQEEPAATAPQPTAEMDDWAAVLAIDEADGDATPSPPANEVNGPSGSADAETAEEAPLPTISVEAREEKNDAPLREPRRSPQIEEIVVTATKRSENLREIPTSIAHLSGEDLERMGAQGIEDIVKLVPGVQFSNDDLNGSRVTTRGIAADGPTSATTGVLFGDLSFSDAYVPFVFLNPHPFDLSGVEVLKGPQGALFGASALNGAVRYSPQKPVMGEWQTRYFVQMSKVSEGGIGHEEGAALNVPIGSEDRLALRLVGIQRKIAGYVDNVHPRVDEKDSNTGEQTHLRALVAWQPNSDWDIGLTYGWQRTLIDDTSGTDNEEGRLSSGNRPSLQSNRSEYHLANLTAKYSLASSGQLVSDTGYVLKDGLRKIDASSVFSNTPPFTLQSGYFDGHSTTLSQELRWVSPDDGGPWNYVAGVFGWQQHIENYSPIVLGDPTLLPSLPLPPISLPVIGPLLDPNGNIYFSRQNFDVEVTELAAFGEVSRQLGEAWKLSLGGRYYRTSSGGTSKIGGLAALVGLASRPPVLDETVKEQGFSPKMSLVYTPSPDLMGYLTVSRGFRVGGVQPGVAVVQNPLMPIPRTFKSDTIWSYEAGLRTAWLDNSLHLDAAVYYLEWKDPQLAQPSTGGEGSIYVTNAGGVEGKGVELSLQYVAPFGLTFSSTASFSRTVTTENFRAANGDDIPPGTSWQLAPDRQTSTQLSWPIPVGSWTLTPAATHAYISGARYSYVFEGNVFDYQQWGGQLSLRSEALPWMPEISLVGVNLTDERGKTGVVRSGLPIGGDFVNYIQPRTLMLRVSGQF